MSKSMILFKCLMKGKIFCQDATGIGCTNGFARSKGRVGVDTPETEVQILGRDGLYTFGFTIPPAP
jgi:hypothetical protein